MMDMRQTSSLCEFFVIMSAPSSVRVKAIVDHIHDSLKDKDLRASHKEGYLEGVWVLLDYGDVIAHIFYEEKRKFYDLEKLWGDTPKRNFIK